MVTSFAQLSLGESGDRASFKSVSLKGVGDWNTDMYIYVYIYTIICSLNVKPNNCILTIAWHITWQLGFETFSAHFTLRYLYLSFDLIESKGPFI
jgi:hypothetical protein